MKVLTERQTKNIINGLMQYMDSVEPSRQLVLELIYGGKNAKKKQVSLNKKYPIPEISYIRTLWAAGKVKDASLRVLMMRYTGEDDLVMTYNGVSISLGWNTPLKTIELMANELNYKKNK